MADTDIIPPSRNTFYRGDAAYRRSISESLLNKVGASINFINDRIVYNERVSFGGYFRPTEIDEYSDKIYIQRTSKIGSYVMSVGQVGGGGNNSMNFTVYNELGQNVGNLFSTAPVINQSGITQPSIGRDIDTSTTIQQVTSNTTYGTLAFTELPTGYSLVPFIVSNSTNSIGLFFNLFLKPQE